MIQHYIEYILTGMIMSDTASVKSKHRDPNKVKQGKMSFGFRFYDREEVQTEQDVLVGKRKNISNWYYWGTPYTKEQVEAKLGVDCRVARNMGYNDVERVVETKHGQMIPVQKEDIIL